MTFFYLNWIPHPPVFFYFRIFFFFFPRLADQVEAYLNCLVISLYLTFCPDVSPSSYTAENHFSGCFSVRCENAFLLFRPTLISSRLVLVSTASSFLTTPLQDFLIRLKGSSDDFWLSFRRLGPPPLTDV